MGTLALLSMGTGGWGAKERRKSGGGVIEASFGVDSCAVGGRQAPTRVQENRHRRLSRRLTRRRRAQLDGD
jgi:hypothetical protein